ncbi:MAG: hypothetical protein SFY96_07745 [Planctomycetota bacterium]|nr:hypothetical protein [Planctomycetota bacterium]
MAGQDFWSDPSSDKPAPKNELEASKPAAPLTDAPGGFWQNASEQAITQKEQARKEQAGRGGAAGGGKPGGPRRLLKRAIIVTAGALVGLILLALVFAPSVAAVYARNTVIGFSGSKAGRLLVQGADLSWSGPQSIGPVLLVDDQNAEIAKVNLSAQTSLLDLAMGGRNLGTITISGNIKLVKEKDGVLNVVRATTQRVVPAAPGTSGGASGQTSGANAAPIQLPPDLAAKLIVKDLKVSYEDLTPGGQSIEVRDLNLTTELKSGKPITLALAADLLAGSMVPGKIDVKASIDGWSNARGVVADFATPAGLNALQVDANVNLSELPMSLIDALAQQDGRLVKAVGDRLSIALAAKGSLKDATASLRTSAANVIAGGELAARDGVITVTRPIEVGLKRAALSALANQPPEAAARIREFPDVTLAIPSLSVKIPAQGALDLRGTSLKAALITTRVAGDVEIAGKPKKFEVRPLTLAIDVADLANGATIKGGTSASIEGQPAGDLVVDINAQGLLDEKGAPRSGVPAALRAELSLANVQTAIAQAFVPVDTINLAQDVGPTLDLRVKANALAGAAAMPDAKVEFSVASTHVRGGGALAFAENRLRNQSPITLTIDSASSIAARFMKDAGGWSVAPGGGVINVAVDGIDVAFKSGAADMQPDARAAKARAVVSLAKFDVMSPAGRPLNLTDLAFNATLAGDGGAKLDINGSVLFDRQTASIQGGFDCADLIGPIDGVGGVVQAASAKPKGSLVIKGVPATLAGAATKPAARGEAPGADVGALVQGLVGSSIDVTLKAAAATPIAGKPAYALDALVAAERLNVAASAVVAPEARIDVQPLKATLTLEPKTALDVLGALGMDTTSLPRLEQRATLRVDSQATSIPLVAGKPDFDKAGAIAVDVTLPGELLVRGLTMPDGTDSTGRTIKRDLGPLGVQDLKLTLRAPGAALGASGGEANVAFSALALAGPRSSIATLSAGAKLPLKSGKPAGDGMATAKIKELSLAGVDRILNKPGFASGALGDRLDVDVAYPIVVPAAAASTGTPAKQAAAPQIAEVTLSAPRLRMSRSLRAAVSSESIKVLEPVSITWNGDGAWLSQFMGEGGTRITRPVDARLTINELVLGQPGVLRPGTFAADLGVAVPSVELVDAKGQRVALSNITIKASRELAAAMAPNDPTAIGIDLAIASAQVDQTPPVRDIGIKALAARLATPEGQFDKNRAQFSVNGQIPTLPTALVDTLANQNGLLVEALGPVIECTLKADKVSLAPAEPGAAAREAGTFEAAMKSQRASASLKGTVSGGAFTTTQPLQVSVAEVTKELGNRFVKGVPFVGELSKSNEMQPASVVSPTLAVPIDGNMQRLNGDVTIDPGELLFKPSKDFAALLKTLNQNAGGGLLGQRLQPLVLNIKNGVITYQKWTLPLGQFNIQTEGVVDLVQQRVDVITWIPLGALSEKSAALFGGAAALGGLDASVALPFRTRGALSGPQTGADTELFAKQLLNNKNIEKSIQKGLEELFKKKDPPAPK